MRCRMSTITLLTAFFFIRAGVAADRERCGLWIDMYRGEPVEYEEVLADLLGSQIVYIGETHTIARHHEMQRRIIGDFCGAGKKPILGMEQLEARHQEKLDGYNDGSLSFEAFAVAVNWSSSWSNYPDYRGVLEAAHGCGGTIVALNAPQEIISKIGRTGLPSLSSQERSVLPDQLDTADLAYRRHLREILRVHAFASGDRLDRLIEAQIARDEAMAAKISDRMMKGPPAGAVYVVIGGATHFSYGLGVPSRVRRALPGVRDRIVLLSASGDLRLSASEKRVGRPLRHTHEDLRSLRLPIADYVHAVSPQR